MKSKSKILKNVLVGGIGLSVLLGCGSGTNNDQGVSFTLFGLFQDETCATGLAGAGVQLSSDPEANGSGVGVVAYLGLQNNLAQGFRTRRAFLKYYVEGAEIQPPSTSQAIGVFLGPGFDSPNSSLPDGFGGGGSGTALGNVGCAGFEVVPPEILAYLNLNRNTLPELPYKMRVEISVTGIGTAGDELTSNPLDLPLEVVQDNIIVPSPGSDDGTDTGTTGLEGISEEGESTDDTNTEIIPVIPGTDDPAI